MELKISYKDGSTRLVKPSSAFFEDTEVRDRHKTIVVTPEMKAMDIALSGGVDPYEVILLEGTEVVYTSTNRANKPYVEKVKPAHDWIGFMQTDNVNTAKDVKAAKKEGFTKKWNPRTETMPWKQGIELLLSHIK